MSETLKVNGLCRCCFTEGEFRSLDAPYRSDGIDSSSALLRETLNITISPMPGPENASTYTICDGCTSRLQDAAQFRNQVLECETKFAVYVENYLKGDCSFSADKIQIEAETLQDEEIEHIKEEIENVNAMSPDEGDNYFNEFDCKIEVCDDGNRIGDARYSCDICNEILCHKDKLQSHVLDNHIFSELAHTEKSGFICDHCQKSFSDKRKLKKHIYYHTRNYICETCGYFTKKASTLRVHIRNVHDDAMWRLKCTKGSTKGYSVNDHKDGNCGNIFSQDSRDLSGRSCQRTFCRRRAEYHCAFCTDTFPKWKSLKSHELAHTEKSGFICDHCQKSFSDRRKLRNHIYYSRNCGNIFSQDSRDFHCAFCTDTFPELKSLKSHELAHTEKSGFICDHCQKSFSDKRKLKKHIYYHFGNYSCETCGNFLKTPSALRIHIRNVHEKIRAFKCDLCLKTYKERRNLIDHRSVHTGQFSHKCDVCFKTFRYQSNFIFHKRIHLLKSIKGQPRIGMESRPGNLKHKCSICGKSFKYKSLLRTHLNTHTKPFKCDVCEKSFSKKSSMDQHQKQHDPGEKETKAVRKNCSGNRMDDDVDYSCDFCKQSFCGKEKLRSHLLAKHMSLNPRNISCPSCGIKFRGPETCLKHLMLHKTAQYHCGFCIDTFPTPSSLKTHEKTHTKKYTCDYCQRSFKLKHNLEHHINAKHYKRVFKQNKKARNTRVSFKRTR